MTLDHVRLAAFLMDVKLSPERAEGVLRYIESHAPYNGGVTQWQILRDTLDAIGGNDVADREELRPQAADAY